MSWSGIPEAMVEERRLYAGRRMAEAENLFEWVEHVAEKFVGSASPERRAKWLAFCERVAEHASGRAQAAHDDRERLLPEFTD